MYPTISRRRLIGSVSPKRNGNSSPVSVRSTIPKSFIIISSKELDKIGVVFLDTDTAVKEYPRSGEKNTSERSSRLRITSLQHSIVLSGVVGVSFMSPPGVKVEYPLQAYFRINSENMGQFERTLIIADEGSQVHYVEGCTAPTFSSESLHSAVVEIVCMKGSRVRYTTIQNWANNVYNLVTKRAFAYEDAQMEWVDGNLGSKLTMKYPSVLYDGTGRAWRHPLYRVCEQRTAPRSQARRSIIVHRIRPRR